MYGIIFKSDGTFDYRGTPCGDDSDVELGRQWNNFVFVKDGEIENVRRLDLDSFEEAPLDVMDDDRKAYLFEQIREFVNLGYKLYVLRPDLPPQDSGMLTCPSGRSDDRPDFAITARNLRASIVAPKLQVSAIRKMKKNEKLQEILKLTDEYSAAQLAPSKTKDLEKILIKNFTDQTLRRHSGWKTKPVKKITKSKPKKKKKVSKTQEHSSDEGGDFDMDLGSEDMDVDNGDDGIESGSEEM